MLEILSNHIFPGKVTISYKQRQVGKTLLFQVLMALASLKIPFVKNILDNCILDEVFRVSIQNTYIT